MRNCWLTGPLVFCSFFKFLCCSSFHGSAVYLQFAWTASANLAHVDDDELREGSAGAQQLSEHPSEAASGLPSALFAHLVSQASD
jgi:hypothetical protein